MEQRIVITVLSERVTSEETDVQAGWAAPYKSSKTDLETSPRPWERRPADQNRRRSPASARGTRVTRQPRLQIQLFTGSYLANKSIIAT